MPEVGQGVVGLSPSLKRILFPELFSYVTHISKGYFSDQGEFLVFLLYDSTTGKKWCSSLKTTNLAWKHLSHKEFKKASLNHKGTIFPILRTRV